MNTAKVVQTNRHATRHFETLGCSIREKALQRIFNVTFLITIICPYFWQRAHQLWAHVSLPCPPPTQCRRPPAPDPQPGDNRGPRGAAAGTGGARPFPSALRRCWAGAVRPLRERGRCAERRGGSGWGAVGAGEGGRGQDAVGLPWPIRRGVPGWQPQALSPPRSSPSSTTCSIFPAESSNPCGDCPSPPLSGVFLALIIVRRPGFPQAFSFPPARSLCKAGSDGERGWGVSAQTHTHIHTHAYTQHPSAAAPGKMPIPFIQARDPLAGGRGMGGVSGDHVGPGSGCRAPGWRRLSPPARRSVRPSVRPSSLPPCAHGAMGSPRPRRSGRAGPPAALTGPPAASRPAALTGSDLRPPRYPALLQRSRQGAARGRGRKEVTPLLKGGVPLRLPWASQCPHLNPA